MPRLLGRTAGWLSLAFLDEISTGVPIAASGLLLTTLGLSTTQLTLALFALPTGFALLVEAPLMLWASARSIGKTVALAVGVVGISALLAARACCFEELLLALMLWYPAVGVATGLGQAALMNDAPNARAANMTRWTIAATLGDLAVPCLLGLSVRLGAGYRAALIAVAVIAFIAAFRLWHKSSQVDADDASEPPSPARSLRRLWSNRALTSWLVGASLCDLMDETLVALAALRVQARFGEDALALTVILGALTLSALAGLTLGERLLMRHPPRRLLAAAAIGSILSFLLFLCSDGLLALTLSSLLMGATAALHHPIAQSQAYAAEPNDAAYVATLTSLFDVSTLIAPPLLGLAVDRVGLTFALSLLLVQPLGLLLVLYATRTHGDAQP